MELPPGFVLPPRISVGDALQTNGGGRPKPHPSAEGGAPRKGQPWTEEEHRLFLLGLQQLGKGNWRGISRQYVTSRTPTQVASHAQKYSLRTSGSTKRRSRFSALEEQQAQQAAASSQANTSMPAAQPALCAPLTLPPPTSVATSTVMMFAWPLLPPQGVSLGMLQAAAAAAAASHAQAPAATVSASPGSSTVVSTSPPSSPDTGAATGTSREQPQPQQAHEAQQQQALPPPRKHRVKRPAPAAPDSQLRPVKVCRPTARLAERASSCGGSASGGGPPGEPSERVATPPTGGAGLQQSASSAFRALVSA